MAGHNKTNFNYFAVKSRSPATKEVVLQLLDDFENLSKYVCHV